MLRTGGSDAPSRNAMDEVDRPGDAALDGGEPGGVDEGDLAGEVVVDRPAQAGAEDRQRRPDRAEFDGARGRDGEHHGAGDDRDHAEHDAAVGVLAEHDPRQQRGEHRLGVQQQGGAGGGHAREAEHQQHRAEHPAEEHGAGQRQQLAAAQAHARCAADQPVEAEAQAGSGVEQPGEQPGGHLAEQRLGHRGAGSEQQRGGDARLHAGVADAEHGLDASPAMPTAEAPESGPATRSVVAAKHRHA